VVRNQEVRIVRVILLDIIKAKEKSVMTKKELICLAIKYNILYSLMMLFAWFIIFEGIMPQDNYLKGTPAAIMFSVITLAVIIAPNINYYTRWKRWDSKFPMTLVTNPEIRKKKNLDHYQKSFDMVAYIIAVDETYKNKLNIKTEEDQEYLMYILDAYHQMKWLESKNAPYSIDNE
jgi:hypothetical protein